MGIRTNIRNADLVQWNKSYEEASLSQCMVILRFDFDLFRSRHNQQFGQFVGGSNQYGRRGCVERPNANASISTFGGKAKRMQKRFKICVNINTDMQDRWITGRDNRAAGG